MIKKNNRISKNEEIKRILKESTFEKNKTYIVYYQSSKENKLRVAISVSKKLGNAVERNKIKRQVRHIVHDVVSINKPVNLVIIVRNKFVNNIFQVNKENLLEVIDKIWRKIDENKKMD